MKKKYTRCRAGLFIWLLSLSTLSSCVNTGRTLGMGLCQSKETKKTKEIREAYKRQRQKMGLPPMQKQEGFLHCNRRRVFCYTATGLAVVGTLAVAGLYYFYPMPSEFNPMDGTTTNTTEALTTVGPELVSMGNATVSSIGSNVSNSVDVKPPNFLITELYNHLVEHISIFRKASQSED